MPNTTKRAVIPTVQGLVTQGINDYIADNRIIAAEIVPTYSGSNDASGRYVRGNEIVGSTIVCPVLGATWRVKVPVAPDALQISPGDEVKFTNLSATLWTRDRAINLSLKADNVMRAD